MSAVRVRLVVGGVRLEYAGDEALFERCVAPLVEAAYGRTEARDPGTVAPAAPADDGVASERVAAGPAASRDGPAVAGGARAPDPALEPAPKAPVSIEDDGFVPQSGQFSSFLQKVGARASNPEQQLVAFAFYLWNYEDLRRFGPEELAGCFRAVGMPAPDALGSRLTDLCERKRFLAPAGGEGELVLTPKGVNYVKTRLLTDI